MAPKTYALPAGAGPENLILLSGTMGATSGDWEPVSLVAQDGTDLAPDVQNLDIALSALRDALKGGKTLADVVTALASVAVTGPLTDSQLRASALPVSLATQPNLVGTYGYSGGAAPTVSVPAGARVLSISCHSTVTNATMQIGSGTVIPIPQNNGLDATPGGSLLGAVTITFTNTDAAFVDWVA